MNKREKEILDLLNELAENIESLSDDNILKFENSKEHNIFLLRGLIDTVFENNPQIENIDYVISYDYIIDYDTGNRIEDDENTKYFEIKIKDSHPAGLIIHKLLVKLNKEEENE